jgi:uncharacterized repeat protein (TIGR03803 family)
MKIHLKTRCWLTALVAGFVLLLGSQTRAQTFASFYNFPAAATNQNGVWTNQFGLLPSGAQLLLGSTLYGTTARGGPNGAGCIYAVGTNGLGFTNLYVFSTLVTNKSGIATNRDGANPAGGLVVAGSTLYGVNLYGGTNGGGTLFSLSTNGTGFTTLHQFAAGATNAATGLFTNREGATPFGGLTLSGAKLYGTTGFGGTNGNGTVFAVQTNGVGFTNLHTFSILVSSNNSDGANPYATLTLAGNTLYGTTQFGGTNGNGTVFSLTTNGNAFTDLHSFGRVADWATGPYANIFTNGDGANPRAQVILVGNTIYGTGTFGGLYGNGTVFALAANGTIFTNLHNFAVGSLDLDQSDFDDFGSITNTDGAWPQAGVTLWNNTLYGVCEYDGLGLGTLFSLGTNGGNFTVVHYFPAGSTGTLLPGYADNPNSGGAYPQTSLMVSDGVFYSSSAFGGLGGSGTLFNLSVGAASITPPLAIIPSGTNVLVSWPTNLTGYALYSTTNLAPAVWSIVSQRPGIVAGQYVVTNGHSASHMFYRLSQ